MKIKAQYDLYHKEVLDVIDKLKDEGLEKEAIEKVLLEMYGKDVKDILKRELELYKAAAQLADFAYTSLSKQDEDQLVELLNKYKEYDTWAEEAEKVGSKYFKDPEDVERALELFWDEHHSIKAAEENLIIDVLADKEKYPYANRLRSHFEATAIPTKGLKSDQLAIVYFCSWAEKYTKDNIEGAAYNFVKKLQESGSYKGVEAQAKEKKESSEEEPKIDPEIQKAIKYYARRLVRLDKADLLKIFGVTITYFLARKPKLLGGLIKKFKRLGLE